MSINIDPVILDELVNKFGLNWTVQTPSDRKNLEEFAKELVERCASLCYKFDCEHSDGMALVILEYFNIDGCRNNK